MCLKYDGDCCCGWKEVDYDGIVIGGCGGYCEGG